MKDIAPLSGSHVRLALQLVLTLKLMQNTVPGGPNNGLVEYVALASANNVPGFVVPNTQFGGLSQLVPWLFICCCRRL